MQMIKTKPYILLTLFVGILVCFFGNEARGAEFDSKKTFTCSINLTSSYDRYEDVGPEGATFEIAPGAYLDIPQGAFPTTLSLCHYASPKGEAISLLSL